MTLKQSIEERKKWEKLRSIINIGVPLLFICLSIVISYLPNDLYPFYRGLCFFFALLVGLIVTLETIHLCKGAIDYALGDYEVNPEQTLLINRQKYQYIARKLYNYYMAVFLYESVKKMELVFNSIYDESRNVVCLHLWKEDGFKNAHKYIDRGCFPNSNKYPRNEKEVVDILGKIINLSGDPLGLEGNQPYAPESFDRYKRIKSLNNHNYIVEDIFYPIADLLSTFTFDKEPSDIPVDFLRYEWYDNHYNYEGVNSLRWRVIDITKKVLGGNPYTHDTFNISGVYLTVKELLTIEEGWYSTVKARHLK
jgi:hypothetical protein